MADPYEQAFASLQTALVDLDGDGVPDVAVPADPMRAINQRFGPMTETSRRGNKPRAELRATEPTNALLDAATLPARMFVEQAESAGRATARAVDDPSLATVTNAGMQNALLLGRPVAAGVVGAVGLAEAARRDYAPDILPRSAEANDPNDPLQPDQRRRYNQLVRRGRDLREGERAELDALNRIVTEVATKRATAGLEGQEEAKRLERERFDAQTRKAIGDKAAALARDRRFSDTEVGKLFNESGGLAPYIAGAAFGGVSRLGTGPGTTTGGKIWNQYVEPGLAGALAGVGAANAPLIADGYITSEPYNPVKEAYEVYARELPEGHPEKQKAAEYAATLPSANPRRVQAQQELRERGASGLIWPAIEGGGSGMVASQSINAAGRLGRAAVSPFRSDPPSGGPAGSQTGGGTTGSSGGPTPQPPGGQPPQIPNQPPARSDFSLYRDLPEGIRNDLLRAYNTERTVAGSPPAAKATADRLKSELASDGINVPITDDRIRATEKAISDFIVANKREPRTPQDFALIRNAATLALGGTVIGNALAPEAPRNALLPY